MTEKNNSSWSKWIFCPIFSPKGFLLRAGLIAVIYFIFHLAGLREYTVILSGNSPTDDPAHTYAGSLGCVYIVFCFAFILLVPILLIAAPVFAGLLMMRKK
jgi:hypothetical protein